MISVVIELYEHIEQRNCQYWKDKSRWNVHAYISESLNAYISCAIRQNGRYSTGTGSKRRIEIARLKAANKSTSHMLK